MYTGVIKEKTISLLGSDRKEKERKETGGGRRGGRGVWRIGRGPKIKVTGVLSLVTEQDLSCFNTGKVKARGKKKRVRQGKETGKRNLVWGRKERGTPSPSQSTFWMAQRKITMCSLTFANPWEKQKRRKRAGKRESMCRAGRGRGPRK